MTAVSAAPSAEAAPRAASASNPAPAVVPSLHEWHGGNGNYRFLPGSRIVVDPADAGALFSDARTFRDDLAAISGVHLRVATAAEPNPDDIVLRRGGGLGEEGYRLDIGRSVIIQGGSATGVFYGEQTVEQMVKLDPEHALLPRGVAADQPDYAHREVMLDMGRHYYTPSYVLHEIREMAWHKLNVLHMHLSEQNAYRIQDPDYPGLAAPKSYSPAEIERFVAYAHQYHVTLVPEIDLPGHATPLVDYRPDLAWSCPSMNVKFNTPWHGFMIDVTKPQTTEFVENLLHEVVTLFKYSPVIHLGGDEYPYPDHQQQCPELVSYAQAHGYQTTEDVILDWQNRIAHYVQSLGRRAEVWSGWDEAQGASTIPLDKNVIVEGNPYYSGGFQSSYLAQGYTYVLADFNPGGHSFHPPGWTELYVTPEAPPGATELPNDTDFYQHLEPPHYPNLRGFAVSRWSDNSVHMPDAFFDWFANRPEDVAAARLWGGPRAATVFAFEDQVDRLGTAPGVPEYGPTGAARLVGDPYGTNPALAGAAFDGDVSTAFDDPSAGGYTGIDLGAGNASTVTKIRFVPRQDKPDPTTDGRGQAYQMIGGRFQGCTDGPDAGCHTLATIPWDLSYDWHELTVTDPGKYRWLRYVSPAGGHADVAEIEFYGGPHATPGQLSISAPTLLGRGADTVAATLTNQGQEPLHHVRVTLTGYSRADGTPLPVRPPSRSLAALPPQHSATLTWRVDTGSASPGDYVLTGDAAWSATGAPASGATSTFAVAGATVPYPALADTFDNIGITSDTAVPPHGYDGLLDYNYDTFSTQALKAAGVSPGGPVTRDGVTFTWPDAAPGTVDNVVSYGQTVRVERGGSELAFLTTGTAGPVETTGKVRYADGTAQPFTINDPDWRANPAPAGADVAVSTPYFNRGGQGRVDGTADVYLHRVSLDPGKTVAAVTLPRPGTVASDAWPALHVFAMTVR